VLACAGIAMIPPAGCGGGGGEATPAGPPPPLPACAGTGPAIERPSELPGDLPLPGGTVLRYKQQPFPGQTVLRGVVPQTLEDAAEFFESRLPDQGYRVGRLDAEPGEREALFTKGALRGGWRVNSIPDCEAAQLTLVIIRQSAG
jgi:hypothetical protein